MPAARLRTRAGVSVSIQVHQGVCFERDERHAERTCQPRLDSALCAATLDLAPGNDKTGVRKDFREPFRVETA